MMTIPTVAVPRSAVRIPVGETFGSEMPNGRMFAGNRLEKQGFAGKRKFRKWWGHAAQRSNTQQRLIVATIVSTVRTFPVQVMRSKLIVQQLKRGNQRASITAMGLVLSMAFKLVFEEF